MLNTEAMSAFSYRRVCIKRQRDLQHPPQINLYSQQMNQEWETFTGRLVWAMNRSGKTNQSALAREVKVRPQSIQYLTTPANNAQGSSYTTSLAKALNVSSEWLERNEGHPDEEPPPTNDEVSVGLLTLGSMLLDSDTGTRRAVAALLTALAEQPELRSSTVRKIVGLVRLDYEKPASTDVPNSIDVSPRPSETDAVVVITDTARQAPTKLARG